MQFLRGTNVVISFGPARLNLCGVDYQRMRTPYLVNARKMVQSAPGTLNLLLSHIPDVFPVAAELGFQLTLSGHTHGGQVSVEWLDPQVNVARFVTPYVRGLYQKGSNAVYVSPGLGTIGLPVRAGVPPEVSVIELCAI